ncbi:MAG: tetratricopeptide repeat protein [Anaerolineae bacterium]|nr:tetratricopeptide repeat protein [Anaerolineae bacterium]
MSRLEIRLLGSPVITQDGEPIQFKRQKAVALLAYLAVTGARHTRDALATLFWPESNEVRAKNALRQTLHTLKNTLGEEYLDIKRENLSMHHVDEVWLDVDDFHSRLAACEAHGHSNSPPCSSCLTSLAGAVELYRDHFLAGFSLPDSAEFDNWVRFQSDLLRDELSNILDRLIQGHMAHGDYSQALPNARRRLELDIYNEEAHRRLMSLYALIGQRAAALRQYESCVEILEGELGMAPEAETTRLYQSIEKGHLTPDATQGAPVCPHNLSPQPTPFVGRREEVGAIKQFLRDANSHLATLTGPGGIGKTRLAIEVAAQIVAAAESDAAFPFPQGVYFISLAPLSSIDLLVPAIADSIGFSFYNNMDIKKQLLNYLRAKKMLLILDNFEHLLEGAELAVEILSEAPGVKLLVTSRERLALEWEWPFEVRGLDYPANGDATTNYSAVQLFLQSARRAYPRFALTREEQPFVTRICRILEGVPLAIKLAAAWVEMFSCVEIAQALENNLDMLATSSQDTPQRHRSVRAAFEHSWQLLSEEEQRALRQLSVFPDEFRRVAAGEVAGASLSLLSALMHKSLLYRSATGWHKMLEVLRQFAGEKLHQHPDEESAVRDRLCAYYAGFLRQREAAMDGEAREKTLGEICDEIANIEAGWEWAVGQERYQEIAHYVHSLCEHYYEVEGYYSRGIKLLERAIAKLDKTSNEDPKNEKTKLFGRLLCYQGRFFLRVDHEKSLEQSQRGIAILRQTDAARELAFALDTVGLVAHRTGEYEEARQALKEAKKLYEMCGNQYGMGRCLQHMGNAVFRLCQYQEAEDLCRQALAIYRKINWRSGIGAAIGNIGLIVMEKGEAAQAQKLFQESLAVLRETNNQQSIANNLSNLAIVANDLGDPAKAEQLLKESLKIRYELSDRQGIALSLINLGAVAITQDKYEEAKAFLEQSIAIFREICGQIGIAATLNYLGIVAGRTKAYDKAQAYHRESIAICRKIGSQQWLVNNLSNLAFTLCAIEKYREAWECLSESLKVSTQIEANSTILATLTGIARLLMIEGEPERAVEIVACTFDHPATDIALKKQITALSAELQAALPTQTLAAAQERGRANGLDYYVAEGMKLSGERTGKA